jgi:hypothetical protein
LRGFGLELPAPLILDVERNRVREVFLEYFRRDVRRMENFEAVLLRGCQKHLKAVDLIADLGARQRRRFQQVVEDIGEHALRQQGGCRNIRHGFAERVDAENETADEGERE